MHKPALFAVALTVLVAVSLMSSAAFASVPVVVKDGDWIKYQVAETGDVAADYHITWASMNVTSVQGEAINVSVLTGYTNGTIYPEPNIDLNLATGAIGDGFFVPTNINVGDQFYSEYVGNITITSVWQLEIAGALRTVVSATVITNSTNPTTYYWDRQTGILVGATTFFPGFTLFTKANETNLWQPQILGLNQTIFYTLIGGAIAVVAALLGLAVILLRRRKG